MSKRDVFPTLTAARKTQTQHVVFLTFLPTSTHKFLRLFLPTLPKLDFVPFSIGSSTRSRPRSPPAPLRRFRPSRHPSPLPPPPLPPACHPRRGSPASPRASTSQPPGSPSASWQTSAAPRASQPDEEIKGETTNYLGAPYVY